MNFDIVDLYGYDDYEYLNDVLTHTLEICCSVNSIFSVIFIDDKKMQELNNKYRNIDRTTDVLSFAFMDNQKINESVKMLGEIYISIPKMKTQAKEYNHSEKRELSFLCCHGLLHLLGYDHTLGEEEEKIQFGLQDQILNDLNIIS